MLPQVEIELRCHFMTRCTKQHPILFMSTIIAYAIYAQLVTDVIAEIKIPLAVMHDNEWFLKKQNGYFRGN